MGSVELAILAMSRTLTGKPLGVFESPLATAGKRDQFVYSRGVLATLPGKLERTIRDLSGAIAESHDASILGIQKTRPLIHPSQRVPQHSNGRQNTPTGETAGTGARRLTIVVILSARHTSSPTGSARESVAQRPPR
jgi:hypothetical protein